MVRYFWGWTPLVIVGTVIFLTLPWLGVIALMLVALLAVAALSWAAVLVPYLLGRAIHRSWYGRTSAIPRTAVAFDVSGHPYADAAVRTVDYPTPELGSTDSISVVGGPAAGHFSERRLES